MTESYEDHELRRQLESLAGSRGSFGAIRMIPQPVTQTPSPGGAVEVPGAPVSAPARRGPALHPASAYLICTNPRSGSWLLSEGLSSTGVAGHPREWFNVLEEQQQRARWGLDGQGDASPLRYLSHVVGQGSTDNGVFGLKLHYYQLADLSAQLSQIDGYRGLPVEEAISAAFPEVRYIWLTREDKARQAISYYRACRTEIWWQIESDGPPSDGGPEVAGVRSRGDSPTGAGFGGQRREVAELLHAARRRPAGDHLRGTGRRLCRHNQQGAGLAWRRESGTPSRFVPGCGVGGWAERSLARPVRGVQGTAAGSGGRAVVGWRGAGPGSVSSEPAD